MGFKCDCFESKQDHFGLNFGKLIYKSDHFVFATQVKQVNFTKDQAVNWQVLTRTTRINLFDVHGDLDNDDMENYLGDKLESPFFR